MKSLFNTLLRKGATQNFKKYNAGISEKTKTKDGTRKKTLKFSFCLNFHETRQKASKICYDVSVKDD